MIATVTVTRRNTVQISDPWSTFNISSWKDYMDYQRVEGSMVQFHHFRDHEWMLEMQEFKHGLLLSYDTKCSLDVSAIRRSTPFL